MKIISKLQSNKYLQSFIISLLSVIAIHYMIGYNNYDNIVYLFVMLLSFYFIKNNITNKFNKISLFYSIFCSIVFLIGQEIYNYHELTNIGHNPFKYILIFLGLISFFYQFLEIIKIGFEKWNTKKKKEKKESFSKKDKIIGIIGILITHLICYLSYYPGMYNYDITTQMAMIIKDIPLSNFHPIVHTIILWFFYKLGNLFHSEAIGIILYSFFQIAIITLTYIYFLKWCEKREYGRRFILISYLYFILNPILLVFSLSTTKDVYFAMSLLLFLTSVIDLYHDNNKENILKYFIFGVIVTLFRNNMIYVFMVFFVFLIVFFRKKGMHLITLTVILIVYFFNNLLCPIIGIQKGLMQEMMSIPLSQMSYIYLYENTYTDKEKERVKEYVPGIENYNPRFADLVKHNFNEPMFKENKKEFISLYLKGFIEHPLRYVYVFLDMNVVYWYPNAKSYDPYSQKIYIEDRTYKEYVLKQKQKNIFPFNYTYKYFHSMAYNENILQKIPIVSNYFLLSFNFWALIIISYLNCIKKKKKSYVLIIGVLLLLFLTYMLGPVSNFRYIYPFYLVLPLLIGNLINEKEEENYE